MSGMAVKYYFFSLNGAVDFGVLVHPDKSVIANGHNAHRHGNTREDSISICHVSNNAGKLFNTGDRWRLKHSDANQHITWEVDWKSCWLPGDRGEVEGSSSNTGTMLWWLVCDSKYQCEGPVLWLCWKQEVGIGLNFCATVTVHCIAMLV